MPLARTHTALLLGALLLLALPRSAAAECEPHVEDNAGDRVAHLRVHRDAFDACPLDEAGYEKVVRDWWKARGDAPRPTSLFLGRAVQHPWLSEAIAAAASEEAPPLGDPGALNRWVAEQLLKPPLHARLAAPFAGTGVTIANAEAEKVLVDEERGVPFDALVWLVLGESDPAGGAAATAIPGTKVSLAVPPEFRVADRFSGLVHEASGSSIMVSELPMPVSQMIAGFTAEALLARGMVLEAAEDVTVAGQRTKLLRITQTHPSGGEFRKWMTAFGSDAETVMLVATYPTTLAQQLEAPLRESLSTAVWDPDRRFDPFEGLLFRVSETERIKVGKRIQNMVLLEPPGRDPKQTEQPFVVVGGAHSPVRVDELEHFAKQRIAQTAQIQELEILEGAAARVGDRDAYRILARAKDSKTALPIGLYQMLVLTESEYFLVQAMVGETLWESYLPEFEAIAASLEIR